MALFNKKEGGLMDVIRCDEPSYLVWKWRPSGEANSTKRENAIRYGSSLRVKEGEVAVFVYPQKDGTFQDFIVGPYDETITTANFPVLASIVGLAFGGASPFQAEIYFINLANIIQVKFGVPYFNVADPRFLDFVVPIAVRGTITFKITDYKEFIKLHRLINFNLNDFQLQIRDAVIKYIKGVVTNIPKEYEIPVVQLETKILQVNEVVESYVKPRLQENFGVIVSAVDIAAIEADKDSEGWKNLMRVTRDITTQTTIAEAGINIRNMADSQAINARNMAESLRIQREEAQRAQKLQTEGANFAVHQLNQQSEVAKTAASSLGKMGQGASISSGGGLNPGAMMAGMAMGAMAGQQMAGMMGNMMQGMNQPPANGMPPPPPIVQYNVAVNGQTTGPFTLTQLAQMAQSGQFTDKSMVWKAGMTGWATAGTVQELMPLFAQVPPPPPPV